VNNSTALHVHVRYSLPCRLPPRSAVVILPLFSSPMWLWLKPYSASTHNQVREWSTPLSACLPYLPASLVAVQLHQRLQPGPPQAHLHQLCGLGGGWKERLPPAPQPSVQVVALSPAIKLWVGPCTAAAPNPHNHNRSCSHSAPLGSVRHAGAHQQARKQQSILHEPVPGEPGTRVMCAVQWTLPPCDSATLCLLLYVMMESSKADTCPRSFILPPSPEYCFAPYKTTCWAKCLPWSYTPPAGVCTQQPYVRRGQGHQGLCVCH